MKIELDLPQVPEGFKFIGFRPPKKGQYFLVMDSGNLHKSEIDESKYDPSCLTFERIEPVDTELEEAKKLIGKWVRYKDRDIAFKLTDVVRDSYSKEILGVVLNSIDSEKYYFKDLAPFPLPRWRCFDSEKPERSGYYYLRSKDRQYKKLAEYHPAHNWYGLGKATDYEWLDEGDL